MMLPPNGLPPLPCSTQGCQPVPLNHPRVSDLPTGTGAFQELPSSLAACRGSRHPYTSNLGGLSPFSTPGVQALSHLSKVPVPPHCLQHPGVHTPPSTQGSQPLPHLSGMEGYQPTSSLSASESQLLLTHPITQRVPATPNPSEPRNPSSFPSPKCSSPSSAPRGPQPFPSPQASQSLPTATGPITQGSQVPCPNTQGCHHLPPCHHKGLTLTMASLVWAMSEMTPSVMMRRTKYWDPSSTVAAELGGLCVTPGGAGPHPGARDSSYRATWLTTGAKLVGP